ncbi:unnamed protein product [Amoebophrya sp. A120]|nr:unnamed protein product [Amoebophrya sp. A120]|eukprot:GSA120T00011838001.1
MPDKKTDFATRFQGKMGAFSANGRIELQDNSVNSDASSAPVVPEKVQTNRGLLQKMMKEAGMSASGGGGSGAGAPVSQTSGTTSIAATTRARVLQKSEARTSPKQRTRAVHQVQPGGGGATGGSSSSSSSVRGTTSSTGITHNMNPNVNMQSKQVNTVPQIRAEHMDEISRIETMSSVMPPPDNWDDSFVNEDENFLEKDPTPRPIMVQSKIQPVAGLNRGTAVVSANTAPRITANPNLAMQQQAGGDPVVVQVLAGAAARNGRSLSDANESTTSSTGSGLPREQYNNAVMQQQQQGVNPTSVQSRIQIAAASASTNVRKVSPRKHLQGTTLQNPQTTTSTIQNAYGVAINAIEQRGGASAGSATQIANAATVVPTKPPAKGTLRRVVEQNTSASTTPRGSYAEQWQRRKATPRRDQQVIGRQDQHVPAHIIRPGAAAPQAVVQPRSTATSGPSSQPPVVREVVQSINPGDGRGDVQQFPVVSRVDIAGTTTSVSTKPLGGGLRKNDINAVLARVGGSTSTVCDDYEAQNNQWNEEEQKQLVSALDFQEEDDSQFFPATSSTGNRNHHLVHDPLSEFGAGVPGGAGGGLLANFQQAAIAAASAGVPVQAARSMVSGGPAAVPSHPAVDLAPLTTKPTCILPCTSASSAPGATDAQRYVQELKQRLRREQQASSVATSVLNIFQGGEVENVVPRVVPAPAKVTSSASVAPPVVPKLELRTPTPGGSGPDAEEARQRAANTSDATQLHPVSSGGPKLRPAPTMNMKPQIPTPMGRPPRPPAMQMRKSASLPEGKLVLDDSSSDGEESIPDYRDDTPNSPGMIHAEYSSNHGGSSRGRAGMNNPSSVLPLEQQGEAHHAAKPAAVRSSSVHAGGAATIGVSAPGGGEVGSVAGDLPGPTNATTMSSASRSTGGGKAVTRIRDAGACHNNPPAQQSNLSTTGTSSNFTPTEVTSSRSTRGPMVRTRAQSTGMAPVMEEMVTVQQTSKSANTTTTTGTAFGAGTGPPISQLREPAAGRNPPKPQIPYVPKRKKAKMPTKAEEAEAAEKKKKDNARMVRKTEDLLLFSKKPRPVKYSPRTEPLSAVPQQLGSLGPDLDSDALLYKKAVAHRMKDFSDQLRNINRKRIDTEKRKRSSSCGACAQGGNSRIEHSNRARALAFAKSVAKPKVVPRQVQTTLNTSGTQLQNPEDDSAGSGYEHNFHGMLPEPQEDPLETQLAQNAQDRALAENVKQFLMRNK